MGHPAFWEVEGWALDGSVLLTGWQQAEQPCH